MLRSGSGVAPRLVAQIVYALPPGKSLVSSSSVGPACLQLLAQRCAGTRTTASPLPSGAVERDINCIQHIRVVDAEKGLLEITNPGNESSAREQVLRIAILLLPNTHPATEEGRLDCACVEAAVRATLMASPSGHVMLRRHSPARGTSATAGTANGMPPPRKIWGATHEAYAAAARDAAAAGFRLVVVTRMRLRLGACGLDGHDLSVVYPQHFYAFRMELPVDHDPHVHHPHDAASDHTTSTERCMMDVVIPLVNVGHNAPAGQGSAEPSSAHGATGHTMQALAWAATPDTERSIPKVLLRCLRTFHTAPVPKAGGVDVAVPLELGATAFARMQVQAVLPYLNAGRKARPHPVPLSMLHRELGWHHVEGALGSLLHALPEAAVLRFGDDLILPITDDFAAQTLVPLMAQFAGAQHGRYAYIGIVRFFTWTWDAAIDAEHRRGSVAQGWLLSMCKRRVGDLMAYEGYLAKYFLYFPKRFRVRQIDGEMFVSFQIDDACRPA